MLEIRNQVAEAEAALLVAVAAETALSAIQMTYQLAAEAAQ